MTPLIFHNRDYGYFEKLEMKVAEIIYTPYK